MSWGWIKEFGNRFRPLFFNHWQAFQTRLVCRFFMFYCPGHLEQATLLKKGLCVPQDFSYDDSGCLLVLQVESSVFLMMTWRCTSIFGHDPPSGMLQRGLILLILPVNGGFTSFERAREPKYSENVQHNCIQRRLKKHFVKETGNEHVRAWPCRRARQTRVHSGLTRKWLRTSKSYCFRILLWVGQFIAIEKRHRLWCRWLKARIVKMVTWASRPVAHCVSGPNPGVGLPNFGLQEAVRDERRMATRRSVCNYLKLLYLHWPRHVLVAGCTAYNCPPTPPSQ